MEQMEIYSDIIFHIMPILETLIAGYCFYRFIKPFMDHGKKAYVVGIAYFLTMLALYYAPPAIGHITAYGIGVAAAFLTMCRIDRRNYRQKIFLSIVFFALREFTYAMAEIFYDRIYALSGNTDYMQTHLKLWFPLYIGVCIVYLSLEFAFMVIAVWCILKSYRYKYENLSRVELFLLTVPSLMGVTGYEVIWYYRRFYMKQIGEPPAVYDFLSVLYYVIAMATIVVIIVLYQSIKTGQKEKLQNELLAVQVKNMKKHIEQVEELYQNIRSIKHDMANHIFTLEKLYNANLTKEADAYGKALRETVLEAAGGINSGNPIADVILREAQGEAEKRKLHLEIDFQYPVDSHINAFDISVILNNALQNALEYTDKREESFVSLLSYRRNNAYMIEIRNSFAGCLQWDEESGLPVTSKNNADVRGYRQTHGYGLSNIRRVAEKYSGDIAVDLKDGEFCLSIMLMIE